MMSKSATRFLQQENLRFKQEVEGLGKKNQALYRYLDAVKALYWASQQVTSQENLPYALNQLLYKTMTVIGASDGSLSRLDQNTNELVFILAHGELSRQLPGYRINSNTGIAGWVAENHEPIIVNHPQQDWRFSQVVDEQFSFFTKSIVSVPIMRRGKFQGVIQFLNKRGSEFDEADVSLLLMLGLVAAIVLEEFQTRLEAGQVDKEDFYFE